MSSQKVFENAASEVGYKGKDVWVFREQWLRWNIAVVTYSVFPHPMNCLNRPNNSFVDTNILLK